MEGKSCWGTLGGSVEHTLRGTTPKEGSEGLSVIVGGLGWAGLVFLLHFWLAGRARESLWAETVRGWHLKVREGHTGRTTEAPAAPALLPSAVPLHLRGQAYTPSLREALSESSCFIMLHRGASAPLPLGLGLAFSHSVSHTWAHNMAVSPCKPQGPSRSGPGTY